MMGKFTGTPLIFDGENNGFLQIPLNQSIESQDSQGFSSPARMKRETFPMSDSTWQQISRPAKAQRPRAGF
jgi:hypothetical protein